jgi:TetR/AcrR family transcriptional regulator, mexCD-oprJ operon repressor
LSVRPRRALQPTDAPASRVRRGLQEQVAAAIVDAAARVIATQGEHANMNDVATEAGIARATLYRYFSTRAELLEALATRAAEDAHERLTAARLEELETREGVHRAVRALLEVGDPLVALARERVGAHAAFTSAVEEPLRRLVERGQAEGHVRSDVPARWLAEMLLALVVSALGARPVLGREDAVAAISSLYLDGAHTRPSAL